MPTREQEEAMRLTEMSLLIDYHLGLDFPAERRERVLQEHRRTSRRFLWRLLGSVLSHPFSPFDGLARAQVRSFSKLLKDEELAALFNLDIDDVTRLK